MPINLRRTEAVSLNAAYGARPSWRRRLTFGAALSGSLALTAWALPQSDAPVQSLLLSTIGSGSARPAFRADCSASPAPLQSELSALANGFDGTVGIAVTKSGCDWTVGARLDQYFPQQSVSKLWVSLSVFDAVDRGLMRLEQPLTIRPADLVVFNQPLRWEVLDKGQVTIPVDAALKNALSLSDNLSNDRLLWTVGGPDRVRQVLAGRAIEGIRFGPGERLLQSGIAGLTWSPDLAQANNFDLARARLPIEQRQASLQRYLADPMDGAQPAGIARALARLARGELLSPESTRIMLDIMSHSRSGPMRLKGGVPHSWSVYHKTGTGQELRGLSTGYNDVAAFRAPDGTIYGVAVMVGQTRRPIPERMALMQAVSRALIRFHENNSPT
jgi:beta-lactamase class A